MTSVPVPDGISPQSLRWAVESSLSERHWTVDSATPGSTLASVHSNGSNEDAKIRVTYGPTGIQIEKLSGFVRSQRYDRWVRLLVKNINKHIAELGPGRAAPPAAAAPDPDEAAEAGSNAPGSEVR